MTAKRRRQGSLSGQRQGAGATGCGDGSPKAARAGDGLTVPRDAGTGDDVKRQCRSERHQPRQRTDARDTRAAGADLGGRVTGLGDCEHVTSWPRAMSEV